MLTEYEWRKQASKKRRQRTGYCGAQYVITRSKGTALKQDRAFHTFLLLVSCLIAFLLPKWIPMHAATSFAIHQAVTEENARQPRKVSAISYQLPKKLSYVQQTYTKTELLRGRMMLIDAQRPLPQDAPAPNTMSIAVYGRGRVPVLDLKLRSGQETVDALGNLFSALQARNITGLLVTDAVHSTAEQKQRIENRARTLMKGIPVERAVRQTLDELDWPGTGELQQEYSVEIRPTSAENEQAWQELLQTAWRFGFIRPTPDGESREAFRFRLVGKAHATAMTYLDLSLEEYLFWLHEKGCIVVEEQGKIRYLILCQPFESTHTAFWVPEGAECEVSLDNMGYAIAACTLP